MAHILIVEDDAQTAREIGAELIRNGHSVVHADDGQTGLALAEQAQFDVITLDRMLPGLDGLDLVSRLRERNIPVPVLMISALSDVDERIAGLRAGGNDYLVKPFALSEMAVRVEVLLRRYQTKEEPILLQAGPITLDRVRRTVTVADQPVKLLHMEFRLLEFLLINRGSVVSRRLIFEQVWGYHFDPGANLINVHIARLRKKLDLPGQRSFIATIKGEGYRLVTE